MTIGCIGIGLLGTALATRLTAAGHQLTGFDPDPAAAARLVALGGRALLSAVDVAASARILFWSLPGPAQVRETAIAVGPGIQDGAIILDTTTGDPEDVERHAAMFANRGIRYLDCEIGGSSRQTAAGESIILCGGDLQAFGCCRSILDAISSRIFHTGPAGTGTRMKLALNIAIGLHRAVLAESLSFAERNGIDPAVALEILKAGPAYSKAMDVKGLKMLTGDYTPEARLAQHLKDVRLILDTGRSAGARLPLSTLHEQLLAEAVERGLGAVDNSAVIELYRNPHSS